VERSDRLICRVDMKFLNRWLTLIQNLQGVIYAYMISDLMLYNDVLSIPRFL